MTEEQLKTYHGIICDAWTMIKKYKNVPDQTDEPDKFLQYYEYLVKDQKILMKKYGNAEFVYKLLWDIEEEINRIAIGKILDKHKVPDKYVEPDGLEPVQTGKESAANENS